jgi:hypothetical protein
MNASTAGSSGLNPSRQKASAKSIAVTAFSQCLWARAVNDMAANVRSSGPREFINLGDNAAAARPYCPFMPSSIGGDRDDHQGENGNVEPRGQVHG